MTDPGARSAKQHSSSHRSITHQFEQTIEPGSELSLPAAQISHSARRKPSSFLRARLRSTAIVRGAVVDLSLWTLNALRGAAERIPPCIETHQDAREGNETLEWHARLLTRSASCAHGLPFPSECAAVAWSFERYTQSQWNSTRQWSPANEHVRLTASGAASSVRRLARLAQRAE
jgi:hypothetical protein